MVVLAVRDARRPHSRTRSSAGSRRSGRSSRSGRRRASSRAGARAARAARRPASRGAPGRQCMRGERAAAALRRSAACRSWLELVELEVEVGGDVLLLLGEVALAEIRVAAPAPAPAAAPASSRADPARRYIWSGSPAKRCAWQPTQSRSTSALPAAASPAVNGAGGVCAGAAPSAGRASAAASDDAAMRLHRVPPFGRDGASARLEPRDAHGGRRMRIVERRVAADPASASTHCPRRASPARARATAADALRRRERIGLELVPARIQRRTAAPART